MYLQRCISASDSKHVIVISYNPHPTVNKTHPINNPINNAESPLSRATERKNLVRIPRIPCASERSGYILAWVRLVPDY